MDTSLQQLRRRLTPVGEIPSCRFTSIRLDGLPDGARPPRRGPGERLAFRLGVFPEPPCMLYGHLFDEDTGDTVAELPGLIGYAESGEILCSFSLPSLLSRPLSCLVIEGVWPGNGVAGCEMSFLGPDPEKDEIA